MKIWANTIVHNEENFIWFAIMSVVDFVDKVLIYDTGSTDKTLEIIKEIQKIKGDKIIFKEVGIVDKNQFTKVRQEMLEKSECDWILIVDGDEIWWESSIREIIGKIYKDGSSIDGIVVPVKIPIGDIYHLQEEQAGNYEILGRKGHLNLRAINTEIPGLHIDFPHPKESYLDQEGRPIQESDKLIFLDAPYLHMTHLIRSSKKRVDKFKYELGKKVEKDFKFPEVLSLQAPDIVPSPWKRLSGMDLVKSTFLTPLRKIKRSLIK